MFATVVVLAGSTFPLAIMKKRLASKETFEKDAFSLQKAFNFVFPNNLIVPLSFLSSLSSFFYLQRTKSLTSLVSCKDVFILPYEASPKEQPSLSLPPLHICDSSSQHSCWAIASELRHFILFWRRTPLSLSSPTSITSFKLVFFTVVQQNLKPLAFTDMLSRRYYCIMLFALLIDIIGFSRSSCRGYGLCPLHDFSFKNAHIPNFGIRRFFGKQNVIQATRR